MAWSQLYHPLQSGDEGFRLRVQGYKASKSVISCINERLIPCSGSCGWVSQRGRATRRRHLDCGRPPCYSVAAAFAFVHSVGVRTSGVLPDNDGACPVMRFGFALG